VTRAPGTTLDDEALARAAAGLEGAPAEDVVAWAVERFGPALCLTASMTDAVLIDVATRVEPAIQIVFIDTQYHFPETLDTVEAVRRRYHPNLVVLQPDRPADDLWRTDPDACCAARKVVPLERALAGKSAWLSGLRRADGPSRAATPVVERDRRGLVKVNPLAAWSDEQVDSYVRARDVPVNPLVARGYPSIGCWPCTRPVAPGEDPRAGRWAGSGKTECGLHL
jgi:phosphoadenosine phosphosulfate reductase